LVIVLSDKSIIDERLRHLVRSDAHTLEVERVGIWLLADEGRAIVNEILYSSSGDTFTSNERFVEQQFPNYFKHLNIGLPIVANNIAEDPRTREFVEIYKPLGLHSMLDVPIRLHGYLIGVICHEHAGEPRTWQPDEQEYATSIANQVSLALARREQQAAEQALKTSEERLEMAVKSAHDWIWDWDIQTDSLYWPPLISKSFGYQPIDFIPEWATLEKYVPPEDWLVMQSTLQLHLEHNEPYDTEFRLRKSDGEYVWCHGRGEAQRNQAGTPLRMTGSIRDITERKHAEQEKEHLIAELEAKNAELERFTYTVSHDLKSPLITIQGFLNFLEQDIALDQRDKIEQDITRIRTAARTMGGLLEDLLELSRVGRLSNPPTTIDMKILIEEAVALVAGLTEQYQVEVNVAEEFPSAFGDSPRLREVLQNLIENAVKFMGDQPLPCIEIGVRTATTPPIYYVCDNGMGIQPAYQERIFNLFERLKPEESEGTGIGLALVKRIIEIHDGKIWVESKGIGHGSTFCFTLPVSRLE
ncbi:MAG: ATP-binding protein, partial [Pseudomonadota bacterium]